ncbi:hypothetical protein AYI70_g990 [Smittium culicis]|uniref:Uncharacterized protein n=1 Tax=Smittium culicis TaxID=133412 RepID=A0A1R1YER5_9FUNG|nr:hypothetical protein AYI70_g990 [Smittium culicis]
MIRGIILYSSPYLQSKCNKARRASATQDHELDKGATICLTDTNGPEIHLLFYQSTLNQIEKTKHNWKTGKLIRITLSNRNTQQRNGAQQYQENQKFLGQNSYTFARKNFGTRWGQSCVSSAYKPQFCGSSTSILFQKYPENPITLPKKPCRVSEWL